MQKLTKTAILCMKSSDDTCGMRALSITKTYKNCSHVLKSSDDTSGARALSMNTARSGKRIHAASQRRAGGMAPPVGLLV